MEENVENEEWREWCKWDHPQLTLIDKVFSQDFHVVHCRPQFTYFGQFSPAAQ